MSKKEIHFRDKCLGFVVKIVKLRVVSQSVDYRLTLDTLS